MMYTVTIEEHISDDFEIEADSPDEAMEIARKGYYDGDIEVMPSTPLVRFMSVDNGEWVEF